MNLSDEFYVGKAVEQGLVSSVDEVSSFECGHLLGLDAIKVVFNARARRITLMVPKTDKQLFVITVEKFRNGYYNGKSLDSIVCEASKFLGERYALRQTIVSHNSSQRILSRDGLYALPSFNMRDVDPCDPRFDIYSKAFECFLNSSPGRSSPAGHLLEVPRSREDIIYFIDKHCHESGSHFEFDMIISYLIKRGLL